MRWAPVVQTLILIGVIVGLAYLVDYSAEGWADWVVFGGIVFTTYGVILAYHHRRYPAATTKRSFTRDSDSRW